MSITEKLIRKVTVTEEMINHKFGEFAFTRTKFTFKKKKKNSQMGQKTNPTILRLRTKQ
jgi:hypothetical protein